MSNGPIRVLLVDDNHGDIRLIREHLADAGLDFRIETAQSLAGAVERCFRPGIDVVLLDLGLPDSVGLDTLKSFRSRAPELPVVVVTGLNDKDIALQAVKDGAQDYLIKSEISGSTIPRVIRYAIERKRSDNALRESAANFHTFFESMTDMIFVATPSGQILLTNSAFTRTLGYSTDELAAMHVLDLHPVDRRLEAKEIFAAILKGERESCPLPLATKSGGIIPVSTNVWFGKWSGKDCVFGICMNLTSEQEAHQRFERLFRNNPALMALSSLPDRKFTDVNDAFLKTTGYSRAEIIGKTTAELGFFPQSERHEMVADKLQADGRLFDYEVQVRRKDGALIEGVFSGEVIASQGQQYFLTVMIDQTKRKQAEQSLQHEREILNAIIDLNPYGVQVFDAEGHHVRANQAFLRMFHSFPPSNYCFFDDPIANKAGLREVHLAVKEGKAHTTPEIWYNANVLYPDLPDKPVCFRSSVFPIMDSDGKLEQFVVMFEDITERKLAESEVRKREEQYRSVVSALSEGIVMQTSDEGSITWNRSTERILGLSGDQLQGRKRFDFGWKTIHEDGTPFPPETHPGSVVLRTREPQSNVIMGIIKSDGTLTWVSINAVPISSPVKSSPSTSAVALSFSDITDRKLAEKERLTMQKLQSVGTLAGGIAHDFNNILLALFGNIALAKEELPDGSSGHELLEQAELSMSRAIRLSKQLLTFATGGAPIIKNISLGALVEEVARFDLSGSNVKLVFKKAKDLWKTEADKGQIEQVIANLTINARQAMPDGGRLYITMENEEITGSAVPGLNTGKFVKITVRDEGSGIDPKHLDRIFDPYFTTKQTGSGLGLATSYSIITKHGGHIGVHSELGKGTTFTIHLPASERAPEALETKQPVAPCPPLAQSARILLMDDEEMVCAMVSQLLKRCGFSVETAPGGLEAIEMYKKAMEAGKPFDVVIMDLNIPGGVGGQRAITDLLAIDPKATVIVSSGYSDDPVLANYANYGFKGIAAKPYTKKELLEVLARLGFGPTPRP